MMHGQKNIKLFYCSNFTARCFSTIIGHQLAQNFDKTLQKKLHNWYAKRRLQFLDFLQNCERRPSVRIEQLSSYWTDFC